MKLIKDYLLDNAERIANQSYSNCHAVGVTSLLLMPGVRLFYAHYNHGLWGGTPSVGFRKMSPLPVAYHSHNNQLNVQVLSGTIVNSVLVGGINRFDVFRHTSGITSSLAFERVGEANFSVLDKTYEKDQTFSLNNEKHTVFVNRFEEACWLIFEGASIENDSLVYTNRDLSSEDFSHLYQKVTPYDVIQIAKVL